MKGFLLELKNNTLGPLKSGALGRMQLMLLNSFNASLKDLRLVVESWMSTKLEDQLSGLDGVRLVHFVWS